MELLLHEVGHKLSPRVFSKDIDRHAMEFQSREPHLEEEKCFGNKKCRLTYDMGANNDSHSPKCENFSIPKKER